MTFCEVQSLRSFMLFFYGPKTSVFLSLLSYGNTSCRLRSVFLHVSAFIPMFGFSIIIIITAFCFLYYSSFFLSYFSLSFFSINIHFLLLFSLHYVSFSLLYFSFTISSCYFFCSPLNSMNF